MVDDIRVATGGTVFARAADGDREQALESLHRAYALGMLQIDELADRAAEVHTAHTLAKIRDVVWDLVVNEQSLEAIGSPVAQPVLAGIGKRALAFAIDWTVCISLALLLANVATWLAFFPFLFYFPMGWIVASASPAQRMLGMKVVDSRTGERMRVTQAFVRSFVLWAASPYLIGVLPMLWDSERQGWHDRVARTFVVEAEPACAVVRRAWDGACAAV